ncbi:hypothetical protein BH10PSE2_BH10PSE2_07190 [soil metagenome]
MQTIGLTALLLASGAGACAAATQVIPLEQPTLSDAEAGSIVSPEADGVAQAVMAAQVAAWGRAHQDPGALIMAARILAEVPMRAAHDQQAPVGQNQPHTQPQAQAQAQAQTQTQIPTLGLAPPVSSGAYLDEAATLSAGNQGVLDAIEHLRGASRGVRSSPFGQGPIFMVREIKARETYGFEVEAKGGEVLRVAAIGDGDTDIDMTVHDADGALVCQDGFADHYPVCTVPRARAGKMRIDIVNRGGVWTKVQILSN